MLYGPDGKNVSKMSWNEFGRYQRWDEFPERADNPPMTVDFAFWYKENLYYCTGEDYGFVIVDKDWKRLAYNTNFLKLLETSILEGKSFHECIDVILFVD